MKDFLFGNNQELRAGFNILFNAVDDNLFLLSEQGTIIDANQTALDNLGYSREELRSMDLTWLYSSETKKSFRKILEQIKTDKTESRDIMLRSKSKQLLPVSIRVVRTTWKGSTVFFFIAKDMSLIKQAQEELLQQKVISKSLIDAVPDFVFYKDTNNVYLGVNQAFAAKFANLPEEEIAGKTDLDIIKDQKQARKFQEQDQTIIQERRSSIFEETIVLADGSVMEVETIKTPYYDEAGNLQGLIGVSRDITSRRQTLQLLLLKEKMLSNISAATMELLANSDYYDAIHKCLALLGEATGVCRVAFFEIHYTAGTDFCREKTAWISDHENLNIIPAEDIRFEDIQEILEKLKNGEVVDACVENLPDNRLKSNLVKKGIFSVLALPIFAEELLWGFVGFEECKNKRVWSGEELSMLTSFSKTISAAIERSLMEHKLKKAHEAVREALEQQSYLARHDPLTGIPNHREILHILESEIERSFRHNTEMAVIMADIDNFKNVNDCYGHIAGDVVLAEVADRIKNHIRKYDQIGRYGGEEFLLVLPESSEEEAIEVGKRILEIIENEPFVFQEQLISVTISLGISTLTPDEASDIVNLVQTADRALYAAKNKGRNRLEIL